MALKLVRVRMRAFKNRVTIGIDPEKDRVIQAPLPICKWALGLTMNELRNYCRFRAWELEEVPMALPRAAGID